MPTTPPDLQTWLRTLENVFIDIRGRGVQWSEDDTVRATSWYRAGLALPEVIRAIERRARALRFVRGAGALPRHLAFYEATVRRQAGRGGPSGPGAGVWGQEQPGPPGTTEEPEVEVAPGSGAEVDDLPPATRMLIGLIDAVPGLVEAAEDPALAEAYRRAGRSLGRSLMGEGRGARRGEGGSGEPDLALALQASEDILTRTLLTGVGEGRARELEDAARRRRGPGGSRRARKARGRVVLARLLAEEYGLLLPGADGWTSPLSGTRADLPGETP